jgi:hypothetical protein
MPRWRDFSVDKVETITLPLISRGAEAVSKRLLEDVGLNAARWILLLDRIRDLGPDAVLDALEKTEPHITAKADRDMMWDKLRRILHDDREYPDAKWRLPEPVLDRLDAIYDRFAPADRLERIAWLFRNGVTLPRPSAEGWQANQRDVEAARMEAAETLFREGGIADVLALARLTETAGNLGKAIYDVGLPAFDIDALIEASVQSENARERDVAHGMILSVFRDRGAAWGAALVAKARNEEWSDTALMTVLRALPVERWTWDQIEDIGGEIEISYWKRMPVFWMSENSEDVGYAIRHLIDVGRARHAVPLTHRDAKVELPTELLVEVLREAARQPFEDDGDHNEAHMFKHYVAETLGILDERADIDRNALVQLEWIYLQLLKHSRRPAKLLLQALSEQPPLFIEMLRAVYRPSEDSGIDEPPPADPEHARGVATQAYRLLSLWNRLPGTRDDGTIDGDVLEAWIKEARSLAKAAGREDIADDKIGAMLSASPMGADGNWPTEPVREVLDLFRSTPMLNGFHVGKINRRGGTSRNPRDGGEQERALSAQFRSWAKAIQFDHPHTAKALDGIADSYDRDARRHDEASERLDWEP